MLLLYAANIYAGYEISIFRARPAALVCGVSAVLPFIGPIIFLSLPTQMAPAEETWEPAPEAAAEAAAADAVNPDAGGRSGAPDGLEAGGHGPSDAVKVGQFEGGEEKPAIPPDRRLTSAASSHSTAASSRRSSPASSA